MSEKIYFGSAKKITTQYGEMTKGSFSEKDLETMKANLKNGWVNWNIKEKRDPQPGKPTHYFEIDTWQPKKEDDLNVPPPSSHTTQPTTDYTYTRPVVQAPVEEPDSSDLPF